MAKKKVNGNFLSKLEFFKCIALLGSLIIGQLGSIPVRDGVTIYVHDIVVFLFFIQVLVLYLQRKIHKKLLIAKPIISFILVASLSLLLSTAFLPIEQTIIGSFYLVRWALYASVYVSVLFADFSWLAALMISGAVYTYIGLVQYIVYPNLRNLLYLGWDPHLYRVFSTFLDPNFSGMYFVLSFLITLYYIFTSKKHKLILYLILSMQSIALLLTYSRSSYLAFFTALFILLILLWKKKRQFILLTVFVSLVMLLSFLLLPKPAGEGVRLFRTASLASRVDNWGEGLKIFSKKPIIGHGFNTLRYVERKPDENKAVKAVSHAAAGIDNSILFIATTTGIIGLLVYLVILSTIIKIGIKLMKNNDEYLGIILISSVVSLLVHSMFVNSLVYSRIMLFLWILAGAAEKRLLLKCNS